MFWVGSTVCSENVNRNSWAIALVLSIAACTCCREFDKYRMLSTWTSYRTSGRLAVAFSAMASHITNKFFDLQLAILYSKGKQEHVKRKSAAKQFFLYFALPTSCPSQSLTSSHYYKTMAPRPSQSPLLGTQPLAYALHSRTQCDSPECSMGKIFDRLLDNVLDSQGRVSTVSPWRSWVKLVSWTARDKGLTDLEAYDSQFQVVGLLESVILLFFQINFSICS